MKESLFEYGKNNKNKNEENVELKNEFHNNKFQESKKNSYDNLNSNNFEKFKKSETGQQAKDIYEKYKDYSQDELMQEFLSTTKERLGSGNLSMSQIEGTVSKLMPFLNEKQKEVLKGLINKLDV